MKYKKGTTLLDASGLQLELEEKLDRPVDLVSFKYLHRRIRDRVLKEQIRIL
jgi:predicted nucleotidyltransferase